MGKSSPISATTGLNIAVMIGTKEILIVTIGYVMFLMVSMLSGLSGLRHLEFKREVSRRYNENCKWQIEYCA